MSPSPRLTHVDSNSGAGDFVLGQAAKIERGLGFRVWVFILQGSSSVYLSYLGLPLLVGITKLTTKAAVRTPAFCSVGLDVGGIYWDPKP